jgi:hypothetical protein
MPGVPRVEPLEPAGRPTAGTSALWRDGPGDRALRQRSRRLRIRALGRRSDRDSVRRRRPRPAARGGEFRLRRRVGPRPLSHSPPRSGRGRPQRRRRPPRDRRRPRPLRAARALRRLPGRRWAPLAGWLRCALEPALQSSASARLDVGGRRWFADPARSRPLRRRPSRADRPCAADHGPAHPASLYLSRAPLRFRPQRSQPAGDGPARPPQARLRRFALPATGASCAASAEAIRRARRRQRIRLVRLGRPVAALEQRRSPFVAPRPGQRLRGRRHVQPASSAAEARTAT